MGGLDPLYDLARYGLLGVLLVLAGLVIRAQHTEIKELQEKRVNEANQRQEVSLKPISELQRTCDIILTILQHNK